MFRSGGERILLYSFHKETIKYIKITSPLQEKEPYEISSLITFQMKQTF